MTDVSRRALLKGLLGAAAVPLLALGATGEADAQAFPAHAPPALRHERRPPPRTGWVWIPGYWSWSSWHRRYVWVPGRWVRARPGWRWRGARWTFVNGRWVFHGGGMGALVTGALRLTPP